jgi:hypothetical protein
MRARFLAAVALTAAGCEASPVFHEVVVVGTDYAFAAPDTLAPGLTAFAFDNRGLRRHELGLTLLRPGVALPDVMQPESLSAPDDSLYGPDIGILLAKPREQPPGRILVDLQPGRTYLLWCDFRDSTGAAQHSDLGMIRTIAVR